MLDSNEINCLNVESAKSITIDLRNESTTIHKFKNAVVSVKDAEDKSFIAEMDFCIIRSKQSEDATHDWLLIMGRPKKIVRTPNDH